MQDLGNFDDFDMHSFPTEVELHGFWVSKIPLILIDLQ